MVPSACLFTNAHESNRKYTQTVYIVKYTQTIDRQTADELFECVWPFCDIGAYRVKVFVASMIWKIPKHRYSYIFDCNLTGIFELFQDTVWNTKYFN